MMRSDEEFEVMKARLLLIKHSMAVVETRIQTGEFGNPETEVREERWKVSGARNNLLAPRVLAVMRSTFSELYEALDCAGTDAVDGKFGLTKQDADEFHELWMWFRERMPEGYVVSWLR